MGLLDLCLHSGHLPAACSGATVNIATCVGAVRLALMCPCFTAQGKTACVGRRSGGGLPCQSIRGKVPSFHLSSSQPGEVLSLYSPFITSARREFIPDLSEKVLEIPNSQTYIETIWFGVILSFVFCVPFYTHSLSF